MKAEILLILSILFLMGVAKVVFTDGQRARNQAKKAMKNHKK